MGRIVQTLAKHWPFGPYGRQRAAEKNPGAVQARTLRKLLETAAQTEYGLQHDFASLLQEKDLVQAYQSQVPLTTDADLRPYMERMLHQEPNILWPGTVSYAAKSGGTTTYGRLYPIYPERVDDQYQFNQTSMLYFLAETGDTSFLKGKILAIGETPTSDPKYPGLLVSPFSGISGHHVQQRRGGKITNRLAVPPHTLNGLTWDEKLDTIADQAIGQDVRSIFCPSSWVLILLHRVLDRYEEKYHRRATVRELWPNLRLISGGGTPLGPYIQRIQDLIGLQNIHFRELYGSVQGRMAFQSHPTEPGMMLWLGGSVFFEFVRWDEFGQSNATRFNVETVEKDVLYVPYLTTIGGFWSFLLDDVIRFDSLRPHKLTIVGRTMEMLCSFGEAVMREELQKCLASACQETNAVVDDYHLAPLPAARDRAHGHQLVIEFNQAPLNLGSFADAYDKALMELNSHYKNCRQNRGLASPEPVSVPPGTFQRWLKNSGKEVHSLTKIPRLSQNRVMIENLLAEASSLGMTI